MKTEKSVRNGHSFFIQQTKNTKNKSKMKTKIVNKIIMTGEIKLAQQMVIGNLSILGFLAWVGKSKEIGKVTTFVTNFGNKYAKEEATFRKTSNSVKEYTYAEFEAEFEFLGDDEINTILLKAKNSGEDEVVSVFYPFREDGKPLSIQ